MIFYLIPPTMAVDLRNFNQCCIARFKLFCNPGDCENMIESVIPGAELDKVGHFILRCFCLNLPEVTNFIVQKETALFLYRLNEHKARELRKFCSNTLKDLSQCENFRETNVLTSFKEKPYFGSMVFSVLKEISIKLKQKPLCEHFKYECSENCQQYSIEIPFQVCSNLVKERQVELRQGISIVPCSKWIKLLEELFVHHFYIGLSMISYSVLNFISSDTRWQSVFRKLYDIYEYHRCGPPIHHTRLLYRQIDEEKLHFPPCMSHLLNVLRKNHRLTHIWRYYFSLFLKDIGLTLEDSLEFWKREYSQSCSVGTACTHSWQQNERKYRYSIRHLYGLEGAKLEKRSKSCEQIQTMQIGMRDEGGCPFVHFDRADLLSTLCDTVKQNKNAVDKIFEAKDSRKPCDACSVHLAFSLGLTPDGCTTNENLYFESPTVYYFCKKRYAKSSLEW